MNEPLAITGLGCISALGPDVPGTVQNLLIGHGPMPRPTDRIPTNHPVPFPVFEVTDAWLQARELEANQGRCASFALAAAGEALTMAGFGVDSKMRIGLALGTVIGAALDDEDFYSRFRGAAASDMSPLRQFFSSPDVSPLRRFFANMPVTRVAKAFKLAGPLMTVTTACTSGTLAIGQAAAWLRSGRCEAALAGGAEKLSRLGYTGFASLMIADSARCRPFDRTRLGLNLGEGAGFIVLEREESARRRGARILGWLLGDGNACDAYHLSRPDPNGRGLRMAVQDALKRSSAVPTDLAFINAHGTGTEDNDLAEARVFAEYLTGVPFFSSKGLTGHTLGAAGGIEAVFTVLCLSKGQIPPSIGFSTMDPACGVAPVTSVTSIKGNLAMSTSVAYGGNNAALVFARGEAV